MTDSARKLLIDEVVQTSAMDCGPAALKALLSSFHVTVAYGRLRDVCQTDVDGTSINVLEDILCDLGFDAEQIMLPVDHLLLDEARTLPAIVVTRLPSGSTHFVVLWRKLGNLLQVMDPAHGRRWLLANRFLDDCARFNFPVSATQWRDWAGSEEFIGSLRNRLRRLRVPASVVAELASVAQSDPGWRGLAALDAATRMTTSLVGERVLRTGIEAANVVRQLFRASVDDASATVVPKSFWSVRAKENDPDSLVMRGGVFVRVRGRAADKPVRQGRIDFAVGKAPPTPARLFRQMLTQDGLLGPSLVCVAVGVAAALVVLEGLLFRALLSLDWELGTWTARLTAIAALVVFQLLVLSIATGVDLGRMQSGRKLEVRFRALLLEKIPRMRERYFGTRLMSDIGERCHATHLLRELPRLITRLIEVFARLTFLVVAISWLDGGGAWLAVAVAVSAIVVPMLFQPMIIERDLRARTHVGAMSRYYLDGLMGLTAIRCHGAERAVRRQHEALTTKWVAAGFALGRAVTSAELLSSLSTFMLVVWLVVDHVAREGTTAAMLLLIYWAVQMPVLGQAVAALLRQYPALRNVMQRLAEPLSAEEEPEAESLAQNEPVHSSAKGTVRFDAVAVSSGGREILSDVDLTFRECEQVAVVGASGAGKSTLMGLLLGWHAPSAGGVYVDGLALTGRALLELRQQTAWVDPSVQLWNTSLLDNVSYGAYPDASISESLRVAELDQVAERFERGFQTLLGEGGGLLSGGEGQATRLARGLNRPSARLVILDEPFRGMDVLTRTNQLRAARRRWSKSLLLYVTHDVRSTADFDRVIVLEAGRVVEDGVPSTLFRDPSSRYAALCAAQEALHSRVWSNREWRGLSIKEGRLEQEPRR